MTDNRSRFPPPLSPFPSSNPTKPVKVGLMMELRENDTVKTGENSKITVDYYSDGHGENYSPDLIFIKL
ncbi:MAG: hypothetical protein K8T10_06320 [Candidatus Eremiobacteraeota bacterium]|nr:hypothetical protein [Candidatus Eremiobacteraeota bacterium]